MYSPQESAEIQMYRQKVNAGTITKEELQRGLELLRRGRGAAHATSAASKERKATSKAKANVNSDSLLDELGGL